MTETPGAGGDPPAGLRRLAEHAADFLEDERDIRVAVLDAVDAGHSTQEIAEATRIPIAVIESWTGAVPTERAPWKQDRSEGAGDELSEQRHLRTGSLTQRVAAAEAKNVRAAETTGPDST
jgi:transposase